MNPGDGREFRLHRARRPLACRGRRSPAAPV